MVEILLITFRVSMMFLKVRHCTKVSSNYSMSIYSKKYELLFD